MAAAPDLQEMVKLRKLAVQLYDIGVFKFGEFTTRIGIPSPIFIDLKLISGYPEILISIARLLTSQIKDREVLDQVCGLPYIGLILSSIIGIEAGLPLLVRRPEKPTFGIRRNIEGVHEAGMNILIISDIVTSGTSIVDAVRDLGKEGLQVHTVLVAVDREQGAQKTLEDIGIELKSLFGMSELIRYLNEEGRLSDDTMRSVMEYVARAPTNIRNYRTRRLLLDYESRARMSRNPVTAKLFQLMVEKGTTICLAADLTKAHDLLSLADVIGPHIVIFKLHSDMIEDFDDDFVKSLRLLAHRHHFFIMEDRKFADKGSVISRQCRRGIFRIAEWADLFTVHPVVGPCVLDGIRTCLNTINEPRGIFIVAELSTKGALTNGEYISYAVKMGKDDNLVGGYMCQRNVFEDPGMIQLTPGVKLAKSKAELSQSYSTPEDIVEAGADIIVVGRGIIGADDRLEAVLEYKRVLFKCYENRVNHPIG